MSIGGPLSVDRIVTTCAEPITVGNVGYQLLHSHNQILIGFINKAAATLLNDLRHAANVSHDHRRSLQEGFENNQSKYLKGYGWNHQRNCVSVKCLQLVFGPMPQKKNVVAAP